ncbi:MAG: ROK family protein, partial [Pikeienuella sp.]
HVAGVDLSAQDITSAARAGDVDAVATINRYIDRLGRALAGVVNIIDPEVIVLGGGLSNIAALYERTPNAMAGHVFSDQVKTRIVRNVHGDSSGVRGAAWLWVAEEN